MELFVVQALLWHCHCWKNTLVVAERVGELSNNPAVLGFPASLLRKEVAGQGYRCQCPLLRVGSQPGLWSSSRSTPHYSLDFRRDGPSTEEERKISRKGERLLTLGDGNETCDLVPERPICQNSRACCTTHR